MPVHYQATDTATAVQPDVTGNIAAGQQVLLVMQDDSPVALPGDFTQIYTEDIPVGFGPTQYLKIGMISSAAGTETSWTLAANVKWSLFVASGLIGTVDVEVTGANDTGFAEVGPSWTASSNDYRGFFVHFDDAWGAGTNQTTHATETRTNCTIVKSTTDTKTIAGYLTTKIPTSGGSGGTASNALNSGGEFVSTIVFGFEDDGTIIVPGGGGGGGTGGGTGGGGAEGTVGGTPGSGTLPIPHVSQIGHYVRLVEHSTQDLKMARVEDVTGGTAYTGAFPTVAQDNTLGFVVGDTIQVTGTNLVMQLDDASTGAAAWSVANRPKTLKTVHSTAAGDLALDATAAQVHGLELDATVGNLSIDHLDKAGECMVCVRVNTAASVITTLGAEVDTGRLSAAGSAAGDKYTIRFWYDVTDNKARAEVLPAVSLYEKATHAASGTYDFDSAAAQVLILVLDADVTSLNITNLSRVGTAILGIEIGTATSVITALDASISVASGALADLGDAAGDKGTLHFWWDSNNDQPRVSIVAG